MRYLLIGLFLAAPLQAQADHGMKQAGATAERFRR